jgi:GH24 family phage-related lysozyme (muramidase)
MTPDELAWSQAYTARNEGGDIAIPYQDSRGIWTIGIGCSGTDPYCSPDPIIGPDTVWTPEQRAEQFQIRHDRALEQAAADVGDAWDEIDGTRQAALLDIAYQDGGGNPKTGVGGLEGYHLMLAAARIQDWPTASAQCLDSANDRETPARCQRNAAILLTGQRPDLTF